MAESKRTAEERAQRGFKLRYLPSENEEWQSVAASTAFGPFRAGDFVVITSDVPVHVNAAAVGGAATTSNPQLPAGAQDWAVPFVTGVTDVYVHLIGSGAGNGCVFKAS